MWAVETHQLTKSYGEIASLVDCSLQVPNACVYGLLGPNGAGKTTLLRTLLGFLRPTSGTGKVSGFDIVRENRAVRGQVSYLPGEARLYRSMRGRNVLLLLSGLHPRGSSTHSLKIAQRLDLDLSRRVMFMSTGMRQKLAIAIVLGCQAPVVILDEPTANLDPTVRSEVIDLVKETRNQGRTVILSSHIFSDVDDACDSVAILRNGRLVANQSMSALGQLHIVSGRLPSTAVLRQILEGERPEFVAYLRELPDDTHAHSRAIEMQLAGPANTWLDWLQHLGMDDLQIDKAGIRAIYQRHHRAAVKDASMKQQC